MEQRRLSIKLFPSLRDLGVEAEAPIIPVEGQRKGSRKNILFRTNVEDEIIHENIVIMAKEKRRQDQQFIKNCLAQHFVFSEVILDNQLVDYLIDNFFYCQVEQNQLIIRQGDDASSFFILESGKLQVLVNGSPRREMHPGEGFGQLALLYNSPRSATVRAATTCRLWGIYRAKFRKVLTDISIKQFCEHRIFLQQISFFDHFTADQKDHFANILVKNNYTANSTIAIEGDMASSFFIIKSGIVKIYEKNQEVTLLYPKQIFGENSLLSQKQFRLNSAVAFTDCTILGIGRDFTKKIFGSNLQQIVYKNTIRTSLLKSPYFSKLSVGHQERILQLFQFKKIATNCLIVSQNCKCRNNIFILLDGTTNYLNCSRFKIFGEEALFRNEAYYTQNIISETECSLAVLDLDLAKAIIGADYHQLLIRDITIQLQQNQLLTYAEEVKKRASNIKLQNLFMIKKLGFGQFGTVYLVCSESRDQLYALKTVNKNLIIENKLERHLQLQKEVMNSINFPFIVTFFKSLKDEWNIYFLMEYIKGLELFQVIRILGLLNQQDSMFYTSSIILILEFIHSKNIIYRDLKPQNIMVAQDGYVKLIDMGTCKTMNNNDNKTFTIIGTPHYMAPQILSGRGYNFSVDFWSLGVILFEFMCGYLPFGEESEDPYQIYQEIIKSPLVFPKQFKSQEAKNLITQLISKVPASRLAGGTFASLKNHNWFKNFNWEGLILHKITQVPYIIQPEKLFNLQSWRQQQPNPESLRHHIFKSVNHSSSKKTSFRKNFDPNWDAIF